MSTWKISEGRPQISRRRSQRVILSLAIKARSMDSAGDPLLEEETRTLVVNEHGAMIVLAGEVKEGQTLRLTNLATDTEQLCKVIYQGSPSEGKTQVGVEFLSPAPDFWLIAFREDV
jgi:hypothetical protein